MSLVRHSREIIDKDLYETFIDQAQVHEEDSEWHPDDWIYAFPPKRLSIILYHYTDIAIHKTLAESQ